MSRRGRGRSARLLLAAALAAGCGSAPPPTPSPSASPTAEAAVSPSRPASPLPSASGEGRLPGTPTAAPSVSGSGSPDTALAVPAPVAWGEVRVVRLPVAVAAGRHFVVADAVTPDGRFVIGSVMRDDFGLARGGEPGQAALYEVATGRVVVMARLQTVDSQVQSAASDGDHVIWMEAADQEGFDWRIFDYRISTGRVRELARAARHGGRAVPGPQTSVSASHGIVLWGQGVRTGVVVGDVSNAAVMQADLATGRVATLASAAGSPALSWPWAAWVSLPADGAWRTVFTDLDTGGTASMPLTPEALSLSGASAAFPAADLHSVWLLDDVSQPADARQVARGADETDYLEWPTLNSRVVAWSQNDQSIVYDRAEQRLVRLPVAYGWASAFACDTSLVWVESGPDTATTGIGVSIAVVDTRSLAILP